MFAHVGKKLLKVLRYYATIDEISKKTPTMAKPNAGSSSMAMVSTAARPRLPHRDGLIDVAYEGFYPNT